MGKLCVWLLCAYFQSAELRFWRISLRFDGISSVVYQYQATGDWHFHADDHCKKCSEERRLEEMKSENAYLIPFAFNAKDNKTIDCMNSYWCIFQCTRIDGFNVSSTMWKRCGWRRWEKRAARATRERNALFFAVIYVVNYLQIAQVFNKCTAILYGAQ